MKTKLLLMLVIVQAMLSATFSDIQAADITKDQTEIHQLALSTWGRPDQPITVAPIVVVDTYAIADWTQGDAGGRSLLHKQSGRWSITLCSGDALKDPKALLRFGVPASATDMLAKQLADAERITDPRRVAQFSRFDGVVVMNGADSESPTSGARH